MARSMFDALTDEEKRGTRANPGSASPLGPTLSMKTGAFLHPLLQAAKDKFPKDNPRGRWLGEMLLGDSPERTGRVAEGQPDQYFHYNRGSGSNVSPEIVDLAGALPIGSAATLAKAAVPFVKAAAAPAAIAAGAGAFGRALKAPDYARTSMDELKSALLGRSLQLQGNLDDAMVNSIDMPTFAEAFGDVADSRQFKGSSELMEGGGQSQFLVNPSEDEIRTFFSRADMKDSGVRTTKDGDGNLYMWNAKEGTHKQFHLGVEDKFDKDMNWDQEYWNNHTEQLYPEFHATEIAARNNPGAPVLDTSDKRREWVRGKKDRQLEYEGSALNESIPNEMVDYLGDKPTESVDEFIGNLLKDPANENSQLPASIDSASTRPPLSPEGGRVFDEGGVDGRFDDARQAAPEILPSTRLEGLPESANIAGRTVPIESHLPTQELAKKYMLGAGMDYKPMTTYRKVDPARAVSIAEEYGRMKHNPKDPAVMSAYQDLADETLAQYQAIKDSGLEIEFIRGVNPYKDSPRMLMDDIKNNNHLYVYSTRDGYGESGITARDMMENPLLAETDVVIGGQKALVNDLFRIVHDINGHNMHGVGFRADGEENAWRSHSMMYSPNARRAMTNETRGQNSWVNYGPDGDANRAATDVDTVYAPQKIGLMPEWVTTEGVSDLSSSVSDSEMVAALSRSKPNRLPKGRGQALKSEQIKSRQADSLLANWRAMSPVQQAAHAASMPKTKGKPPTVDRMKFKYEDDAKQARKNVQGIENLRTVRPTVDNPLRAAYPGIYKNPSRLAAEANRMVAPEDPALKELFGVTRADLYGMLQDRVGGQAQTIKRPKTGRIPTSPQLESIMSEANTNRLLEGISTARREAPALVEGMAPWYIMDPMYRRQVELVGEEEATRLFNQMNTLTGMSSPGSGVDAELHRGTAANYLAEQGRFSDFVDKVGIPFDKRGPDFPSDIIDVPGHAYHATAHTKPMVNYLEPEYHGDRAVEMGSVKVPSYIEAGGVPGVEGIPFQTKTPIGDAHFSRSVGLADVRESGDWGASITGPELRGLEDWWQKDIAEPSGLEAVPAQAINWGLYAPQTGVETLIGAGKLELLARRIMDKARRTGENPYDLRDRVLKGQAFATAAGAGVLGAGSILNETEVQALDWLLEDMENET
jgi:hypothetical protein